MASHLVQQKCVITPYNIMCYQDKVVNRVLEMKSQKQTYEEITFKRLVVSFCFIYS